jgi:cardiolipin synthase
MLNIPNSLTVLRICMIPAIIIALDYGHFGLGFGLFVAAGVTDGLDGLIARMTNTRTELGAYLDPLADKGLVIALLVSLISLGRVPGWVLTIILTRDIVCLGGYLLLFFLTGQQIAVRPSPIGKMATFLQLTGISGALLILWRPVLGATLPDTLVLEASAIVTAAAGLQYVTRGLIWYQEQPE